MKKWDVEMMYGINVSISRVEADTQAHAVQKAREMIRNREVDIDPCDLNFEEVTYIKEI